MYWLCFPHALFTKNNYQSWIFSLISNSKCEVIDPNFDLYPTSGSGLIIFSHYPLQFFWFYSIFRDLFFVLLASPFEWFWCASAREAHWRCSKLDRTKVGTLEQDEACDEVLMRVHVYNSYLASRRPDCKLLIFIVAARCATPSWSSLCLLITSSANQRSLKRVGVVFEPSSFLFSTTLSINSAVYNMNFTDQFSFFNEECGLIFDILMVS